MNAPILRLTALAHGGGCGCKLRPPYCSELLAEQPAAAPFADLLVGTETGDDAAVWQLDDKTCIVATTDFFMPMVDDPYDFGRIAATNALSDVYAMGGRPIFALAILGMPIDKHADRDDPRDPARRRGDVRPRRESPLRAAIRSIRPSRSTASPSSASCARETLRRNCDARAWRRADSHQADRRRNLFGRDQEGRALATRAIAR